MSEAQDGWCYPCEACGAEVGTPCPDNCPGMTVAGEHATEWEMSALASPLPEADLDEAAAKLMAAVHRLPFGGLVGIRGLGAPDRQDYPHEEWLWRLAEWMAEYQEVLAEQVAKLSADSTRLISLQMERDMVRNYLKEVPL